MILIENKAEFKPRGQSRKNKYPLVIKSAIQNEWNKYALNNIMPKYVNQNLKNIYQKCNHIGRYLPTSLFLIDWENKK